MRNVIVSWLLKDSRSFERQVPLTFIGEMNLRLGFQNSFDILFLEGYELLDESYKRKLRALGFVIHDVGRLYQQLSAQYNPLRPLGMSEFKFFLRWLVIAEYFPGESIIHYDGDVVFNIDPVEFSRRVAGKTFVLQGCPAITVIHNRDWFNVYRQHLKEFAKSVQGYSQAAWDMRRGWEVTLKTKWAGSRFHLIIGHDQDLLSHLIHTDQLPQDNPQEILSVLNDFILFENPLCIDETNADGPFEYKRLNGIDYLNNRAVAFWHMQSDWVYYLSKFVNRQRFFFNFQSKHLQYKVRDIEDVMNRVLRKLSQGRSTNRLAVYEFFFNEQDFSGVLTDTVWWKRGVFR